MLKNLIALCFLLLFTIPTCIVNCEKSQPKTISNLESELAASHLKISTLDTDIENKNELIAMLRIKTVGEEEQIEKQETHINNLKAEISNLMIKINEYDKELSGYIQQTNKCQSTSCLCKSTDVHSINVPGNDPFPVSCDSTLAGSGWTVILRRINGNVNFDRNWSEYQKGFGDLQGEFFMGLDKLHLVTKSQPYELYIYLQNFKNETRYARYDNFLIGDNDAYFEISSLGVYSGNAGDALVHHKNMKFSTSDSDNDNSSRNCADENSAGWWYNSCYQCNLNGPYNSGFYWYPWQRNVLKFAQVMIRPKTT